LLPRARPHARNYGGGPVPAPPLAFWLADIAFRAAGNHVIGVYLLAQLCGVATFWTLYLLSRAGVGGQQAVLAVLLTMTVVVFSSPGVEFGPLVLARPLWALLLLHSWQLIGQNRRDAWFAWSIDAGLLLPTSSAAGLVARRRAVRHARQRGAGGVKFRLVRPQAGRYADHFPAAGRSAGAQFCLFLRTRARTRGKPDLRPVQSRPCGRRRGHRAFDVGTGRDRRDRR